MKKRANVGHNSEVKPSNLLPIELLDQIEIIAEKVHDEWIRKRLEEGWVFGTVRDDTNRRHPGLIPYIHLSEGEKEYDRQTALQTLATITQLGYKIVKTDKK